MYQAVNFEFSSPNYNEVSVNPIKGKESSLVKPLLIPDYENIFVSPTVETEFSLLGDLPIIEIEALNIKLICKDSGGHTVTVKKDQSSYTIEDEKLNAFAYGDSLEDALEMYQDMIIVDWLEFVKNKNTNLSSGALKVKENLEKLFKEICH